jgi:hypothetical protein
VYVPVANVIFEGLGIMSKLVWACAAKIDTPPSNNMDKDWLSRIVLILD